MNINNDENKVLTAFDKERMKGAISSIVTEYFDIMLESEQIEIILNKLKSYNPTLEAISERQYDFLIKDFAKPIVTEAKLRANCIGNAEPEEFKSKKVNSKENFKKAIIILLVTAVGSYGLVTLGNHIKSENVRNEAFDALASEGYAVSDIVKDNTTRTVDSNEVINVYDTVGIADDIVSKSQGNKDAFDVALNGVYRDIDENELLLSTVYNKMNAVLQEIQLNMSNAPEDSVIKQQVDGCHTILDFLLKNGGIGQNHKNYDEIKEIAEALKYSDNVNLLSPKQQVILKKVLTDYGNSLAVYNQALNNNQDSSLSDAELAYDIEFNEPNQGGRK